MKNTKQIIIYVGIGSFLMLLLGIVYSYSMFRLEIETSYNVNHFESGIPYMTALFFFSSFMAIGGFLYSKRNTLIIAVSGILLISVGFILSSFVDTIFQLTITYGFLVGTGVGLLYGLPLRIIAQLDSPKTGLITGIVLLGFGLSPLVFAPLINASINKYGLNTTFMYLGLMYLITLPLLAYALTKRDVLPKVFEKPNFDIIKNKKFQSLYVLFIIATFIGLTFIGFTGNIGKELIGIEATQIAILVGLFAVFNGIGRPIFGYLHDQLGFKKSATISFLTIIAATSLHFFFSDNYFVYLFSFIIFYLNFGGWLSLTPATTIELFGKKDYSKNFGIMYTGYGLGALSGNLLGGVLVESVGLKSIFLLMSIIAIIGLLFLQIQFKSYKKE